MIKSYNNTKYKLFYTILLLTCCNTKVDADLVDVFQYFKKYTYNYAKNIIQRTEDNRFEIIKQTSSR